MAGQNLDRPGNTYVSIALLVLLQLDSAIAPRFGLLRRL
jgi:hypothetical protein